MEAVGIHRQASIQLFSQVQHHYSMNTFSANFRAAISFHSSSSIKTRVLCTSSSNSALVDTPLEPIHDNADLKCNVSKTGRVRKGKTTSSSDAQLKENWLDSLTYPHSSSELASPWAIGIDPDVSGALALLKNEDSGISAQVFDSPHLKILVGKKVRRRLDTKSIIELLQSFGAPIGINSFWHFWKVAVVTFAILLLHVLTAMCYYVLIWRTTAYLEQSLPYPQDGKQGWWSGGFNYGLWIGALVASGFSVVPVPSLLWKNEFKLSGNGSNKDDSRELASKLFPSLGSLLERKKDHGRAEALLIAAYGKGLKMKCNDDTSQDSALP